VAVLAPATPPGIEELLAHHAPEDVDALGGMDVQQFRQSPLGAQLIQKSRPAQDALGIPLSLHAALPVESLHAMAFAAWGVPGEAPEGFLLLSGSFETETVLEALKELHGVDGVETTVEGVKCVGHRSETPIVAGLSSNVLYLGPASKLKAVSRVASHQAPSAWKGRRRRIIRDAVGGNPLLWGVGALTEGVALPSSANPEEVELFRSLREGGICLRLGRVASLRVWGVPDSPDRTGQIVEWLTRTRGMFALITRALDDSGRLSAMLERVEIGDLGDAVTVQVEVSSRQLEEWVDSDLDSP